MKVGIFLDHIHCTLGANRQDCGKEIHRPLDKGWSQQFQLGKQN